MGQIKLYILFAISCNLPIVVKFLSKKCVDVTVSNLSWTQIHAISYIKKTNKHVGFLDGPKMCYSENILFTCTWRFAEVIQIRNLG